MTIEQFTKLQSFLSGYFHEDWQLDSQDADFIVAKYISSNPNPNDIDQIISQIGLYLSAATREGIMEPDLLADFGCYYLPSADGINPISWLNHVADLLRMSKEL